MKQLRDAGSAGLREEPKGDALASGTVPAIPIPAILSLAFTSQKEPENSQSVISLCARVIKAFEEACMVLLPSERCSRQPINFKPARGMQYLTNCPACISIRRYLHPKYSNYVPCVIQSSHSVWGSVHFRCESSTRICNVELRT